MGRSLARMNILICVCIALCYAVGMSMYNEKRSTQTNIQLAKTVDMLRKEIEASRTQTQYDEKWLSTLPNTGIVVHEHLGDIDDGDDEYWCRLELTDRAGKIRTIDYDVRGHVLRIDDVTAPILHTSLMGTE